MARACLPRKKKPAEGHAMVSGMPFTEEKARRRARKRDGRAFQGRKSQLKGTQWCRACPSGKKKPAEGHANGSCVTFTEEKAS
ncbi:hypothetical protein [Alkalibacterium putridalgicola]|uniref:hypothetical protein n=1 Tax=Alkalibacterium putridalgicola TaxID=426703 RepID=UPI0011BEC4EB|nr:hypothetical protein [Alkalibacterium putridalgicola]